MLGLDGKHLAGHPTGKFWFFLLENHEESAIKHCIEEPDLLNFMNLSSTFCSKL